MRPIRAALVLAALAVLLAVCGFHKLALVPALAAAPLVAIIVRVARRRRRHVPIVDAMDEARARDIGDGKAIRDAQASWMREQNLLAAHSVIKTVQGARAEIAHAGAAEARAVLDALERQAREHPEGVPGAVVAEARMRCDELMRSNIQ